MATGGRTCAFVAASFGWMLDAFDVMLYSLVLASLMRDLDLTKAQGGLLEFGDARLVGRRRRALRSVRRSIRTQARADGQRASLFNLHRPVRAFADALAARCVSRAASASAWAASGRAARRSCRRSWPADGAQPCVRVHAELVGHRLRRGGDCNGASCCRRGAGAACSSSASCPRSSSCGFSGMSRSRRCGERIEPDGSHEASAISSLIMFHGELGGTTALLTFMNACTLFGWWGLNTWVPAYLVLPPDQGGVGLSTLSTSGIVFITQVGMWFGYVSFGFISDAIGRRRAYVICSARRERAAAALRVSEEPGRCCWRSAPSSRFSAQGTSPATDR